MQKVVLQMSAVAVLGLIVLSADVLAQLPGSGGSSNGGISVGYRVNGSNGSTGLSITAFQSSSRSISSTSPIVTGFNGQPAFITSGIQRPFVTGVVPVVSGMSSGLYAEERYQALRHRLSRGRSLSSHRPVNPPVPAKSVSRQQAAWNSLQRGSSSSKRSGTSAVTQSDSSGLDSKKSHKSHDYFTRGRIAEENGKPQVAAIYYRMAISRATSESLKQQALSRLKRLQRADRMAGRSTTNRSNSSR